jgi:hypothetical protein
MLRILGAILTPPKEGERMSKVKGRPTLEERWASEKGSSLGKIDDVPVAKKAPKKTTEKK